MRKKALPPEESEYIEEHLRHLRVFLSNMRHARDRSQEWVSNQALLDKKTYGRIERGEVDPSYTTLLLVARGLGLPAFQFFAALARFLEGKEAKTDAWLEGRYYKKDGSEWIEIWRSRQRDRHPTHGREKRSM